MIPTEGRRGGVRRRRKLGGFVLRDRLSYYCTTVGRDNSVGIATRYRLDGPVIESLWEARFSAPLDGRWGPPSILYNGYRVFPGDKAAGAWR